MFATGKNWVKVQCGLNSYLEPKKEFSDMIRQLLFVKSFLINLYYSLFYSQVMRYGNAMFNKQWDRYKIM